MTTIIAEALRTIEAETGTQLEALAADASYVTVRIRFDDLEAIAIAVADSGGCHRGHCGMAGIE